MLATLKQPARTASQRVKMRVNYAQVNTPGTQMSATDRTWVEAGGAQVAPVWTYYYQYYAGPMYGVKTNWFDVPASGDVSVRWASGSQVPASRYSGATVRSYEYRRYEAGASPTWLPLRFPGQYADEESGLFENWNRFYDPSTGRYSASDPQWFGRKAKLAWFAATAGPNGYAYVDNKPLIGKDPTGLKLDYDRKDLRIALALAEMRKKKALRAALDRMEADKKNVFKIVVVDPPPAYSRSTPPSQPLAAMGGGFTISEATPNNRGGLSDSAEVNLGGHYQYREENPGSDLATLNPMTWESLIAHELGHEYANVYGGDSSKNAIDWENQMREPTDQRPYGGP